MFVKNNTTGKYYIDGVEVSKEEYQSRLEEWRANYVPPEPEENPDLTADEALDIILGGAT